MIVEKGSEKTDANFSVFLSRNKQTKMRPKLTQKSLNDIFMMKFLIEKLETNKVKNRINVKESKNEIGRDFFPGYLLIKSKLKILDSMNITMRKTTKKQFSANSIFSIVDKNDFTFKFRAFVMQ